MKFKSKKFGFKKSVHSFMLAVVLCVLMVGAPAKQAKAYCVEPCPLIHEIMTQLWIEIDLWELTLLPTLEMFADQMTATAMQQVLAIGMFLDAKHQLETQRVFQTIRARNHKDYQPSAGMCEFGSSVKSLAASERKGELTAHALSQRSQDRNMRNANTSSSSAADGDQVNRLEQWKRQFCDVANNGGGLYDACEWEGNHGAENPDRTNMDIDYVATIENPWTINVDFTNDALTDEESNLFALANNLYGFDIFKTITQFSQQGIAQGDLNDAKANYMDARALIAKRSVAENSFNAIASMKSSGTAGSREYLAAILENLGVSPDEGARIDDINRLLGFDPATEEPIAPSYYAQMEVLTKKIYQNPEFYTNLYDKPANIERKEVAMQAIGLMQKFDLYKSYLRTEATLSVLLETAVEDLQDTVQDQFANQNRN